MFILTNICAVKKIWKKKFFADRPTDPSFSAYVTGNIDLFRPSVQRRSWPEGGPGVRTPQGRSPSIATILDQYFYLGPIYWPTSLIATIGSGGPLRFVQNR
jgi:hypothetical protein